MLAQIKPCAGQIEKKNYRSANDPFFIEYPTLTKLSNPHKKESNTYLNVFERDFRYVHGVDSVCASCGKKVGYGHMAIWVGEGFEKKLYHLSCAPKKGHQR